LLWCFFFVFVDIQPCPTRPIRHFLVSLFFKFEERGTGTDKKQI